MYLRHICWRNVIGIQFKFYYIASRLDVCRVDNRRQDRFAEITRFFQVLQQFDAFFPGVTCSHNFYLQLAFLIQLGLDRNDVQPGRHKSFHIGQNLGPGKRLDGNQLIHKCRAVAGSPVLRAVQDGLLTVFLVVKVGNLLANVGNLFGDRVCARPFVDRKADEPHSQQHQHTKSCSPAAVEIARVFVGMRGEIDVDTHVMPAALPQPRPATQPSSRQKCRC